MPSSDSPFAALGTDKPPKPVSFQGLGAAQPLYKGLVGLGVQGVEALKRGGQRLQSAFEAGTPRQEALQAEQENVLRQLLAQRMGQTPTQLFQDVGSTAFGFINPNVISPLSQLDVNMANVARRARGINTGAVDTTAERLRNARIASGRYYDVARDVYSALPNLYNQIYNAGLTNDQLIRGYLPEIQAGYRNLELANLLPGQAQAQATNEAAQNFGNIANAIRSGVYGYQQPRNFWDRAGQFESGLWSRVKDAAQIYASLYGGGMLGGGGGGGGGVGGMLGGGGGGGLSQSYVQPQFNPAPGGAGYSPQFYAAGPQ